ncbi:histone acetyltransferase type B catalytic subunit [Rhizoctonia solani 123E]|uniref:Histone acetyltransferase type B catalytic subunit n=1 Tax=Rhizoctonia solani 123E TaxID=1423351 RepID=A0A074S343_9AGAM|nr:histone acetyltransferase type B catalytic subunit [Rhizoctonia solani 123E]
MGDWLSNANDALCLKLVRTARDTGVLTEDERSLVEEFHPTFTYPIFGEKETIYGYADLKISLFFASGSLSMFLNVASTAKLPSKTADDVEGTLYKFIPPNYSKSAESFQDTVEKEAATFRPLGEKIHTYVRRATGHGKGKSKEASPISEDDPDAVVFEVYHSTWDTPGFREYHRRMQIFILLYIEGGSYIQEDEEKWEFTVLYERRRSHSPNDNPDSPPTHTYHFAGYSSLYPFWCWPDKVRLRLSQFVILPPYQHAGHGSALYNAIYQFSLGRDDVVELTVEDPSETFEDLRDRNDMKRLISLESFMQEGKAGKFGPPVDKAWVEKWRRDLKMASRQFHRLIEMLLLRELDSSSKQAQKAFRIQVKERLYRFNYEILAQLEKEERLEKLEETFQNVRTDYQRILATVK